MSDWMSQDATKRTSKGMETRRAKSFAPHPEYQTGVSLNAKMVAPKPAKAEDSWWARPEAADPAIFYALAHEATARLNLTTEPKHRSGGETL